MRKDYNGLTKKQFMKMRQDKAEHKGFFAFDYTPISGIFGNALYKEVVKLEEKRIALRAEKLYKYYTRG